MLAATYTEQVRELYAALYWGELEKMLERLDENVNWEAPCGSTLPWGGLYRGKAGFIEWLDTFARHVNVEVFEPREFSEQNGKVVVFLYTELSLLKNGRKLINPEVHYWTFQGERLVQFQAFNNNAAQEAAFLAS